MEFVSFMSGPGRGRVKEERECEEKGPFSSKPLSVPLFASFCCLVLFGSTHIQLVLLYEVASASTFPLHVLLHHTALFHIERASTASLVSVVGECSKTAKKEEEALVVICTLRLSM